MNDKTNIFLIGPMGSGKTTVGRILAEKLGLAFYDSDQVIEVRCGAPIPWVFDIEGETGFRYREHKVLDELTALSGIVLATGGGVIINAENRKHLIDRGHVIYLKVSVTQQLERLRKAQNRPLLETEDPKQKLLELVRQREPLYEEMADFIVNTDNTSATVISKRISMYLAKEVETHGNGTIST